MKVPVYVVSIAFVIPNVSVEEFHCWWGTLWEFMLLQNALHFPEAKKNGIWVAGQLVCPG